MSTSPQYDSRLAARAVLAGSLIVLLAVGIRATFGLFMQPMGVANGWSRDVFSMAFAIQNLVWGVMAIVIGAVADRFGAGRAISLSALSYALGYIGLRFATTGLELYLSAGILIGIGQAGTTFAVVLPVMARAVPPASRSVAMGIAGAGGSLGQFLIVPTAQGLITSLSWSGALWALSVLVSIIVPLAWFLRGKSTGGSSTSASLSGAIGSALRHSSYHFLFWSYFVCGFQTSFITLHLPAYVVDKGLSPANGAIALALVGLFNVFGSFLAGKLGGKHSKKLLLAGIYWSRGLAIIFLLTAPLAPWSLYLFASAMGLFWLGTVPLTQGIIGDFYGYRFAATLSGIVFLGHQVGAFLGVWLGGKLFVMTGAYDVVWWLGVALSVVAGLLCLPLRASPTIQMQPARG